MSIIAFPPARAILQIAVAALAALLLFADTGLANTAQCATRDKLVKLALYSQFFLKAAQYGDAEDEAAKLRNLLKTNPIVDLRMQMRRAGLSDLDATVSKLYTQQKSLVQVYYRAGEYKTAETALQIGAIVQIEQLKHLIAARPCTPGTPEKSQLSGAAQTSNNNKLLTTGIFGLMAVAIVVLACLEWLRLMRRRRDKRHPCKLPCTLTISNRDHAAALVDLSLLGAKIRIYHDCHPGDPANVKIGHISVPCQISWANSDYAGLEFRKPIAANDLESLVAFARLRSAQMQRDPAADGAGAIASASGPARG